MRPCFFANYSQKKFKRNIEFVYSYFIIEIKVVILYNIVSMIIRERCCMVKPDRTKQSFLMGLVRNSVILSALDRFTAWIYAVLSRGFFAYIFTGYPESWNSRLLDYRTDSGTHYSEFTYGVCRRIESSTILFGLRKLKEFLMNCRLKVFGCFLVSFGAYSEIIILIRSLVSNKTDEILKSSIIPAILIFAAIPLLLSYKNLKEAIADSFIGRLLLKIIDFTPEQIINNNCRQGHMGAAFLIGLICGIFTYFLSPIYILLAFAALVWLYLIMSRPEIGVLTLFAAVPWLPTMLLAVIVLLTAFSWGIKLFRGKRHLKFEIIDIAVFGFILFLLGGGLVSLSSSSLKPALLMICLAFGYFLAAGLLSNRQWLIRASVLTVVSASAESLWALFLKFTGGGYSSHAWLDSEMFGAIGSRAVGSLDNPNMLGEYLVLILPIAAAMVVGKGEGLRRIPAFFACCLMGACLLFTWSRGAWLALILTVFVFLLMWHHRSLWLIILGVASLPILPSVLPASVLNRFASIGNMADSSTSYRVYIWRASVKMIKDNLFTGIGIGEGAWANLYPLYALDGVGVAPHSHNLFLQIWLETGIFGLLAFLTVIFLIFQAGFSYFSKLSSNNTLKDIDINSDCIYSDTLTPLQIKKNLMQLRLSVIGPLCGVFAVLVQGMTDYSFYNYRLYLMFWLVAGLAVGYIRDGRKKLSYADNYKLDNPVSYDTEFKVIPASKKNKQNQRRKV